MKLLFFKKLNSLYYPTHVLGNYQTRGLISNQGGQNDDILPSELRQFRRSRKVSVYKIKTARILLQQKSGLKNITDDLFIRNW